MGENCEPRSTGEFNSTSLLEVVREFGLGEPIDMDYKLHTLKGDLFGGLTAAVVALPVSLAFGVASGLGAQAGLYSAIAMGFFVAVFGERERRFQVPPHP